MPSPDLPSSPLNQALTSKSRSKGIYLGTDRRNQACFSWKRKGKGKPHYVNYPQRPEGPSHREKHDLSWRSPWDKRKSTKRQNVKVRLLFKKMKLLGEEFVVRQTESLPRPGYLLCPDHPEMYKGKRFFLNERERVKWLPNSFPSRKLLNSTNYEFQLP